MPVEIPVNSEGNRRILVDPDNGTVYGFRTYYSKGQNNAWFLDLSDVQGNLLFAGRPLAPGSPNILEGQGDNFRDVQLAVVLTSGEVSGTDNLGDGLKLIWFNAGEENPLQLGDPLLDIDAERDWGWTPNFEQPVGTWLHNELINRELPDQHPISAIPNMQGDLYSKLSIKHLTEPNPHPQYQLISGGELYTPILTRSGTSLMIGVPGEAANDDAILVGNGQGGISIRIFG